MVSLRPGRNAPAILFCGEEILFGVRDDGENDVFVSFDFEIKAPAPRHPRLPDIQALTVFLGLQGRMPEIGEEKAQLLGERFADGGRESPRNPGPPCS